MSITAASPRDLPFVVHLAKKFTEELGFLSRLATSQYIERGRVTLSRENGEPCGFFLIGAAGRELRIFQAAVQYDAQGLHHGHELLARVVTRGAASGANAVTLHCRDGLPANAFWSALGFEAAGLHLGGGARRKIVCNWRLSISDAVSNPRLPYHQHFLAALRAGAPPRIGTPESRRTPPAACQGKVDEHCGRHGLHATQANSYGGG